MQTIKSVGTQLEQAALQIKPIIKTTIPYYSGSADLYKIAHEGKHIIVNPPIPVIQLQSQCKIQIQNQLLKGKRNKDSLLLGYEKPNKIDRIHFLNSQDDEDIGYLQESQKCLCIGIKFQKEGPTDIMKKISAQLKLCTKWRNQNYCQTNYDNRSKLNQIVNYFYKNYRLFIIFEKDKEQFYMHTVCFYPNISFKVKQIKITPFKCSQNDVLKKVSHFQYPLNTFGYLSQDDRGRLILIDKQDPSLSEVALIGVWIYADFKNYSQQFHQFSNSYNQIFWTVVVEFIRKQKIKKVSTLVKNSGIICTFQKNQARPNLYMFDINEEGPSTWALQYKTDTIKQLPQILSFRGNNLPTKPQQSSKQLQKIIPTKLHQKVTSKPQLLRSSSPIQQKFNQLKQSQTKFSERYVKEDGGGTQNIFIDNCSMKQVSDSRSQRSYDDRDMKIQLLKKQLEIYKNKCEDLEQKLYNTMHMQSMMMLMMQNQQNSQNPLLMMQLKGMQQFSSMSNQFGMNNQMFIPQDKKQMKTSIVEQKKINENYEFKQSRARKSNVAEWQTQQMNNKNQQISFYRHKSDQIISDPHPSSISMKKQNSLIKERPYTTEQLPSQYQAKGNPILTQDYKNISFGEDNSENQSNEPDPETYKLEQIQKQPELIYSRSPQFKFQGSFGAKHQKQTQTEDKIVQISMKQNKSQDFHIEQQSKDSPNLKLMDSFNSEQQLHFEINKQFLKENIQQNSMHSSSKKNYLDSDSQDQQTERILRQYKNY